MLIVSSIISLLILCLIGILVVLIIFLKRDEPSYRIDTPKVSILIAARNEADNIIECLESIHSLSYPNYEVWVGNDHSSDDTKAKIEKFIADKTEFKLLDITHNMGSAKGKSNVLAHLAHQAEGEFLFITDADIRVPQNWIQAMLGAFNENTGIVSGFTLAKGDSFLAKMQRIDWSYAMAMVKVVSDLGIPIVGIGNNMALRREAYFATGGYENLPFSIVEDFQLFQEIIGKGYGFRNLLNDEVCSESKPMTRIKALLQQRKRWMFGAFQLPKVVLLILILQAIYYTLAIVLCVLNPTLGLNLVVFKMFIQGVFIKSIFHKVHQKVSIGNLILFEFYQLYLSTASLTYYFLGPKIIWKGRKY